MRGGLGPLDWGQQCWQLNSAEEETFKCVGTVLWRELPPPPTQLHGISEPTHQAPTQGLCKSLPILLRP